MLLLRKNDSMGGRNFAGRVTGWLPARFSSGGLMRFLVPYGRVGRAGPENLRRVRDAMLSWQDTQPGDIGDRTAMAFGRLRSSPESVSLPEDPDAQGGGAMMRAAHILVIVFCVYTDVVWLKEPAKPDHTRDRNRTSGAFASGFRISAAGTPRDGAPLFSTPPAPGPRLRRDTA